MVGPEGFEPSSRSYLELAVYKSAVLPLNYRPTITSQTIGRIGPDIRSKV